MKTYLGIEAFLETGFVHPGGLTTTRRMLSAMELTGSDRALDLGCGTGATAGMAAATGAEVVAFERMPAMLASSLRWRWLIRRHRKAWSQLESWIFIGDRAP